MPEWIEPPGTMRRLLRLDFTELGGYFDWLDENGERTYTMMQAVLFRRVRDNKLFRVAKDREPEDGGRVHFLEEL